MREMPRGARRGEYERVDPEYASTVEVFDNLTHQEIHAGVQLMNPAVLLSGQQAWQGAATALADAVGQAHTEIGAAIADGWRGAAAGSAAAAIRDFERTGRELADVMAAVGLRLSQAGDAAETLRAGVGEPSAAEPDLTAALLDPSQASENASVARGAENARQDVVRMMDSVYIGAFVPTGSGVPAFPEIPATSGAPASTTPTGALSTGIANPEPPAGQSPAHPAATMVSHPAADPQSTAPAAHSPSPTPTASPATTPPPTPSTPAHTTPSTATIPASTAPTAWTATDRPITPASTGPAASVPAAAASVPVTAPASSSDDQRKRQERRDNSGTEAITGMGAGAVGGLMGGAMAASDTPRSGPSAAARNTAAATSRNSEAEDELDDDLHFIDDDLTFLEPSDEHGELIGAIDPTTPPVLGEWTEED